MKKRTIYIILTILAIAVATFVMVRKKRRQKNADPTPLAKEGEQTPDIKIDPDK